MVIESVSNKVCIRMASVYEEVRMRLYQKGEALKRKDANYCSIQAGSDEDRDTFPTFVRSAMNDVDQAVVKRMYSFDWSICSTDSSDTASGESYLVIEYVPYQRYKMEDEVRMRRIVEKSVFDFVVNFVMGEWLKMVSPELARDVVGENENLLFRVRKAFASLSPAVRRRPTDLAGI